MKTIWIREDGTITDRNDPTAFPWVDADIAQEMYDNLLAFIEAVEDDTIRVRPSDREVLLDILARSNDAIYKADKD